jgi:hypothetical protein
MSSGLEKRVFGKEVVAVRVSGKQLQNATYRDPHSANARFAGAFPRLHCNAIKRVYCRHMISLDDIELAPAWPEADFKRPVAKVGECESGQIGNLPYPCVSSLTS